MWTLARALLLRPVAMASVCLALAGCGSAAFACDDAEDCVVGDRQGVCQPNGWCSFDDGRCPSGQRYGDLAGDGLAGTCVDPGAGETGNGDTTGPSGTVGDPSSAGTTSTASSTLGSDDSSDASGPTTAATTSTDSGPPASCGDGTIDGQEECDDGPANGNGGPCTNVCQLNECGDGYLGPGEDCDGEDPGADCSSHGFAGGQLSCTIECAHDLSGCLGCGKDGCAYGPCVTDKSCPDNESCFNYDEMTGQGFCTAPCESDQDCSSAEGSPAGCVDLGGGLTCAVPCDMGDVCPMGLECIAYDMTMICVWASG